MVKKLNTNVHVVERDDKGNTINQGSFGPDDDMGAKENAWAAKAITNPDVWADDDFADDSEPDDDTQVIEPPNGGTGPEGSTQLNYDEATLEGLRGELKRRELPTSGNKADLVARLREDDEARASE